MLELKQSQTTKSGWLGKISAQLIHLTTLSIFLILQHTGADAYEDNAEGMFTAFDRIVDFLLAKKSGELYVGECTVPADLSEGVKDKALELAQSLIR